MVDLLTDKVIVLSARPATVKQIYDIELPRPRVMSEIRYEDKFISYAREIWDDLRAEVKIG